MSETDASPPVLERLGARATIRLNRPKTPQPPAGRRSRRAAEAVCGDRGRFRASRSGPHRHRPRLQRRLRPQLGRRAREPANVEQKSAGSAFEAVVNRLEDIGIPTICRLNGGVYGGSTDLALACDFRIGVDTCEMFMPAARLGLHYYKSGIARYVARLGLDNAKRLFLTAEKIGATEMLRIGYLTVGRACGSAGRGGRSARRHSGRQCADRDARHEADHP